MIGVLATAYFSYLSSRTLIEFPIRVTQTAEAFRIILTDSANHTVDIMSIFITSGWMGDIQSLDVNSTFSDNCYSNPNCIKIIWMPSDKMEWVGLSWQYPANNWGDKPGCNLRGARAISFWAKGENGNENIRVFANRNKKGFSTESGVISLSKDWNNYTVDLQNKDLSNVSNAFGFFAEKKDNPNGVTFYLDSIEFTGISIEQVDCP